MLNRMSATEMAEWEMYYLTEPFGTVRQDIRFGMLAHVIAVSAGGKKAKIDPVKFMPRFDLRDFVPNAKPKKKKRSTEYLKQIITDMHRALTRRK